MAKKKFYITTAIPYVNAKPHLGHTLEYFIADTIYRYHKLLGEASFLVSGADENAIKNVQAAEKARITIKEHLDKYSQIFREFYELVDIHLDEFRRGSDEKLHWPGVQKLWELADKNGDIYKKKYKGLYCIGCESFKTEKDLVDGKCPEHNKEPELVEEENYFFKLSRYQDAITQLIESDTLKVYPTERKNEILSFVKQGLEDFSISRSNTRARGIGVPVPGDDTQKMFVWFDALTIYMTAIGFGYDEKLWEKWWPAELHVIGKDIIRFHAVYWPAMLLSAQLPLPESLLVHGFITSGGQKMSKSLGNVVDPYELIEKYGVEPLRYYLLAKIPTQSDGDYTDTRFFESYNADLANGLGNLVSRVAKMAENANVSVPVEALSMSVAVSEALDNYQFDQALGAIWGQVTSADKYINEREVWKLESEEQQSALKELVQKVRQIAFDLQVFLPKTAERILTQFNNDKIVSGEALFPRLT